MDSNTIHCWHHPHSYKKTLLLCNMHRWPRRERENFPSNISYKRLTRIFGCLAISHMMKILLKVFVCSHFLSKNWQVNSWSIDQCLVQGYVHTLFSQIHVYYSISIAHGLNHPFSGRNPEIWCPKGFRQTRLSPIQNHSNVAFTFVHREEIYHIGNFKTWYHLHIPFLQEWLNFLPHFELQCQTCTATNCFIFG